MQQRGMFRDMAWLTVLSGFFLVFCSIYNETLRVIPKVQYKFIPRDVYYDQFFTDQYNAAYKPLFER